MALANVPAEQGVGALLPRGQELPSGQAFSVPVTWAPGQKKPAGQGSVGATVPRAGQCMPALHGAQSDGAVFPVALLCVPGGQSCGAAEPDGQ